MRHCLWEHQEHDKELAKAAVYLTTGWILHDYHSLVCCQIGETSANDQIESKEGSGKRIFGRVSISYTYFSFNCCIFLQFFNCRFVSRVTTILFTTLLLVRWREHWGRQKIDFLCFYNSKEMVAQKVLTLADVLLAHCYLTLIKNSGCRGYREECCTSYSIINV